MALQTSGPLKFSEIKNEYGLSNPVKASDMKGLGGTPTTNPVTISNYYGTSAGPSYPWEYLGKVSTQANSTIFSDYVDMSTVKVGEPIILAFMAPYKVNSTQFASFTLGGVSATALRTRAATGITGLVPQNGIMTGGIYLVEANSAMAGNNRVLVAQTNSSTLMRFESSYSGGVLVFRIPDKKYVDNPVRDATVSINEDFMILNQQNLSSLYTNIQISVGGYTGGHGHEFQEITGQIEEVYTIQSVINSWEEKVEISHVKTAAEAQPFWIRSLTANKTSGGDCLIRCIIRVTP